MKLISKEDFRDRMYHEAFEVDSELQKWDSGCWIRYKLFENILDEMPTVESRPRGRWIGISYDGYADGNPVYDEWECSEYGYEISTEETPPYCEMCGAEMEGDDV